jgi:hypothetical protein
MPDAAARADMRIEIVKREINQGALAGLGSKISDYAAQLVINALDTYDEEALKAEFRRGFDAGEMNAALLGDRVVELEAALDRVRALHTIDGHGPGWAGSDPVDAHAWCEGCEAGGLDDDGQCPTLAVLDGQATDV